MDLTKKGSNNNNWWEFPSTRESMRYNEQYFPINATLSVAGTAQDLWTPAANEPTINLFTNPSFETGDPPTSCVAVGSAISQSLVQALYGTNSILVNPDNSAAGEGFYITINEAFSIGETITASCYVRGVAAAGDARIRIYGVTSGTWLSTGSTVSLAADWLSRLETSFTNTVAPENSLRVYVVTATQHNNNFYADGMQVEFGSLTTYCDGSQGLLYSWDGTSHASISRRRPALRVIRGYTLHTDRDIYIAYGTDRPVTASSTVGRTVLSGADWWTDHNVNIRKNISFVNKNAGETPTITGEVWGI